MKLWILAAGLIFIIPLSEGMLWLNPPPAVPVAPTEISYDLADIRALNDLAAREPTHSERAATLQEKRGEYAAKERERCQDDYVCLIAWAERRNPYRARSK